MKVKLLSLAAGLAAVASAHAVTVADLAADFSIGSNPNGNWSYGYSTLANAGDFLLYDTNTQVTATYGANTAEGWSSTNSPTGVYPYVAQNVSNWLYGGSVSFTAGTMIMHPGNETSHLFSFFWVRVQLPARLRSASPMPTTSTSVAVASGSTASNRPPRSRHARVRSMREIRSRTDTSSSPAAVSVPAMPTP